MEEFLAETYGVTVYQEQVMLLSRQLADFTRGQSDALRKAMGKKKKDIVDQMKPMFIEGGKKNGHDPKILEKIWADWEKFASYAFNKSHAACYSWVAYQTAYLKANYPAEFMAALLTRRKSDIKEITKLMDECKNMKIATLGPDVNESFSDFGVNKKGEIRFGLAAIKGMGEAAAEAIISERNANGPYADIYDFVKRLNFSQVNRKAFESLALSGGFDSFGIQREQYFAVANTKGETFIETLVRFGQNYQNAINEAKASLFGFEDMNQAITLPVPPKNYEHWSHIEKLNKERELVGIYLSAHPLDDYSVVLKSMCNTQCVELADKAELAKKQEIVFGGIVTGVRTGISKRDKPFGIVTIEDYSGSGELAFFDDWHMWSAKFTEGTPLYIKAKYTTRFPNSTYYTFNVGTVEYMSDVKEKSIERFTISLRSDKMSIELFEDLSEIINENPGKVPLYLQVYDIETNIPLLLQAKNGGINVNHKVISFIESKDELNFFVN